jgi:hypothetical protein
MKNKQLVERLKKTAAHLQQREQAAAAKRAKWKAPKPGVATDSDRPVAIGALKLRDACAYLGGIHPATMRRLIERGMIRPNKTFRHLLFSVDELNKVIEEGMVE